MDSIVMDSFVIDEKIQEKLRSFYALRKELSEFLAIPELYDIDDWACMYNDQHACCRECNCKPTMEKFKQFKTYLESETKDDSLTYYNWRCDGEEEEEED